MKEHCSHCNRVFHWWNGQYFCGKCNRYFCYYCCKRFDYSTYETTSHYQTKSYFICNQCYDEIESSVIVLERNDNKIIDESQTVGLVSSKDIYGFKEALIDLKFEALKKNAFAVLNVTAYTDKEQITTEFNPKVKMYNIPINVGMPEKSKLKFTLKGEAFKKP